MNTTELIPPDVQARLIEAATELMAEQEFTPLSERDLELWLGRNAAAVGRRAIELQDRLLVKTLNHQREVVATISEAVYREIRKKKEDE